MSLNKHGYIVHKGCDHVFFIGFLGAGKTTLARNLGQLFQRPYVDTDRLAERICKKPIDKVFSEDGEEVFRDAEYLALKRLKQKKSLLVSCGGGIVERPENIKLMQSMGVIVFLAGDLDDSMSQIQYFKSRPDFSTYEEAKQLYEHRYPLYVDAADYTISISGKSFNEVAQSAGALLWEEGLL